MYFEFLFLNERVFSLPLQKVSLSKHDCFQNASNSKIKQIKLGHALHKGLKIAFESIVDAQNALKFVSKFSKKMLN